MLTLWQPFLTARVAVRPACLFGGFWASFSPACSCLCALWALLRMCARVILCACTNNKLTAAVKFLPEHHRGEADGSWQAARARGGGRGRWRWAGGRERLGCQRAPVIGASLWSPSKTPRRLPVRCRQLSTSRAAAERRPPANQLTVERPLPVLASRLVFSFCWGKVPQGIFVLLNHIGLRCSIKIIIVVLRENIDFKIGFRILSLQIPQKMYCKTTLKFLFFLLFLIELT